MGIDGWDIVLWIHLLAMAFFVGGQLFLGAAVVPVFRAQGGIDSPAHAWMQPIARRFGWGSLIALGIALVTGAAMASNQDLWRETWLNVKMTLVVIAIILVAIHVFVTRGSNRLLQGLILIDSLAIVLVATAL